MSRSSSLSLLGPLLAAFALADPGALHAQSLCQLTCTIGYRPVTGFPLDADGRQVVAVGIDANWHTNGVVNKAIASAVQCAVKKWNHVLTGIRFRYVETGSGEGVNVVIQKAPPVDLSPSAPLALRQMAWVQDRSGGTNIHGTNIAFIEVRSTAIDGVAYFNGRPIPGPPAGRARHQDNCGRIAHELAHKLGMNHFGTCAESETLMGPSSTFVAVNTEESTGRPLSYVESSSTVGIRAINEPTTSDVAFVNTINDADISAETRASLCRDPAWQSSEEPIHVPIAPDPSLSPARERPRPAR